MKTFPNPKTPFSHKAFLIGWIVLTFFVSRCRLAPAWLAPPPTLTLSPADQSLSTDEIATLSTLEQIDDYPLYTMHYADTYASPSLSGIGMLPEFPFPSLPASCQVGWGCSLFTALGDPHASLYGRNFDWQFSPAVLLFTDPPDGYASVSMVDIEFLGFKASGASICLTFP
jgi:hypothetical protein